MNSRDFHNVSRLYTSTKDVEITQHYVANAILRDFCIQLYSLEDALGELAEQDYWRSFLIPLKRIRFGLSAAIFTNDYRMSRIGNILQGSKQHLKHCEKLYPNEANLATIVVSYLQNVYDKISVDPLKEKLYELSDNCDDVVWVIKESRFIPDVESIVEHLSLEDTVTVIHPRQLRQLKMYKRIIFVGPSRWFPNSAFTAPRSTDIHLVIYDWISDRIQFSKVFDQPLKSSTSSNRTTIRRSGIPDKKSIDPEKMLIITDKLATIRSKISQYQSNDYDAIEAISVFLERGWVVFIDATENANTLIIDLEQEVEERIQRIPVTKIHPGTFILVRTGGGGDYILPVADRILGEEAQKARELQRNWKQLLRQYVDRQGLLETSIELIDLGSDIANEINVRNWMSPRSISTRSYNDFLAIMRLIHLEPKAEKYWSYMKMINSAHRSAGYKIRDLLLNQVRDVDVNLLQKQGKMDFKLDEDDEGGITAFRVESVATEPVSIPYSQVGQPIELDATVWQE